MPPDYYRPSKGRISEDDQSLKAYFEATFVQKLAQQDPTYTAATYQQEAYGTGRLLRRLFRLAIQGVGSWDDIRRYEHFVEDWDAYIAGSTTVKM